MARWTSREEDSLKHIADLAGTVKEAYDRYCDEFGSVRTYDSIQKKIRSIFDIGDRCITEPPPIVDAASIRNIKKFNREKGDQWLYELLEAGESILPAGEFIPVHTPRSDLKTLCMLISDVHCGKWTRWFDTEVMEERLESFPSLIAQQDDIDPDDIDEVLVMLGGDLVEGEDIFSTQNGKLICPAFVQVQILVESLMRMINQIRKVFPLAIINIYAVPGNHGRSSKTANPMTNWDNVVTYILSLVTHDNLNVNVYQNYEEFCSVPLRDTRFLLNHQGTKHISTPAMGEKIAGWVISKEIFGLAHGHWHRAAFNFWLDIPVISNGSVCGPDDLSEKMAKDCSAAQAYFTYRTGEAITGCNFIRWSV